MSSPVEHYWYFRKKNLLQETDVGPLAEAEFVRRVIAGEATPKTRVSSPTRTNGQWPYLEQIPGLMAYWSQGESRRQAENHKREAELAEQRAATQAANAAAKQAQQQNAAAVHTNRSAAMSEHSDCTDLTAFETLAQRVQAILISGEHIEFIAVQRKPLINISPDAMVSTNRRLIFYRPKLLGRFEFFDYLWFDLANAHIQQNLLGAVFSARHVSGVTLQMDYLSREGAQRLYRIAQEREEQARLARIEMQRDTLRAGAMHVNVQSAAAPTYSAPITPPAQLPASSAEPASTDPVLRLQKLKQMADAGLISADEFAEKKRAILNDM